MTPGLPHPRNDIESSLTAAFRAGFTDHWEKSEEGKTLHPAVWKSTRKVWLFTMLVNLDALQDYSHFVGLYALVFGKQTTDIPTLSREQHKEAAISQMAKSLAADDQPLSAIQRRENAYFSCVGSERHALARKLNVASAPSGRFVADRKLWHWIANAVPCSSLNDNTTVKKASIGHTSV